LSAQADTLDPDLIPAPRFAIFSGMYWQISSKGIRSNYAGAEISLNRYTTIGVQGGIFLQSNFDNREDYEVRVGKKSWEAGVYLRRFLFGQLTGRRSNFFFGPEIRHARYDLTQWRYNPITGAYKRYDFREGSLKILCRSGWHVRYKHIYLEAIVPFGLNFTSSNFYYQNEQQFAGSISENLSFDSVRLALHLGIHVGYFFY
jgi:hypothetical protein